MPPDQLYCSLDLELTGFDPTKDEILEVGFVFFRLEPAGPVLVEQWSQTFSPSMEVHPKILGLTGISKDELAASPKFSEYRESLQKKLGDAIIVGHGVALDIRFLEAFGLKLSGRFIDTLELAQFILPTHHSYNLENLMHTFQVLHAEAHRALADCKATIVVLNRYLEIFQSFPAELKDEIKKFSRQAGFAWQKFLDVSVQPRPFVPPMPKLILPEPVNLPAQGVVPLPLGYEAGLLVLSGVTKEQGNLLLVTNHNHQVLTWWRHGLVQGVFGPEDTFDPEKFELFKSRPDLLPEEVIFILKVLVWKYTNWQTETILDLNLSFAGGQYRSFISGREPSVQEGNAITCCAQKTFLQLADKFHDSSRTLVVSDLAAMEKAITASIGDRASWSYVVNILRSIYNPESGSGAVQHRETVLSALSATDLFFGLVSLNLQKHFGMQAYITIEDLQKNPYLFVQLEKAAANYGEQLEKINASLAHEGLERFIGILKNFFFDKPGRVRWVELGFNRCVLFNYPLEISDLFHNAVDKYQKQLFFSESGNQQVMQYMVERLGLKSAPVASLDLAPIAHKVSCHLVSGLADQAKLFDLISAQSSPTVVLFSDTAEIKDFYKTYYGLLKQTSSVFAQDYSGGSNKMLRNFGIRESSILLVTPSFLARTTLSNLKARTLIWTGFSLSAKTHHPYDQALADLWPGTEGYWSIRNLKQLTTILKLFYTSEFEQAYFDISSMDRQEGATFEAALKQIGFLTAYPQVNQQIKN